MDEVKVPNDAGSNSSAMRASLFVSLLLVSACASTPAVTVRAPDGLKIAVEERAPGVEADDQPVLVLLHGWACDRTFWGELPDRLSRDHHVVTLDLPGHGESGTDRKEWSVVALGEDVAAVCATMALDDIVLVGHSMGAPVALSAAKNLSGKVRGVIAVDSLHALKEPVPAEGIASLVDLFEQDWRATMDAAVTSMVPGGPDSKLTRWIIARAVRTDRRAALGLMSSFAGLDLAALANSAGVPVRVVNAAPYPGGGTTELDANQALVDYDAVLIEDVGHYLQLERPDLVEDAIRAFLGTFESPR